MEPGIDKKCSEPFHVAEVFYLIPEIYMEENIEARDKKVVAEQLSINEADIKNESAFIEDLGADSLDTVELVMALEDAFSIEIPDSEQEKLRTVQQAIDYIKEHQKA